MNLNLPPDVAELVLGVCSWLYEVYGRGAFEPNCIGRSHE